MAGDSLLDRRDFLEKSAATAGLGLFGILDERGGQVGDIQYGPREVPYAAFLENDTNEAGEFVRNPIYDKIDQDEWVRRQTALDVRDQVSEMLGEEFEDELIYASFTAMDQSPTGFGVEVDVDRAAQYDLQDIEDQLPTELEGSIDAGITANRQGIPVVVNEVHEDKFCTYIFKDYNPVPGGQVVANSDGQFGTATAEFFHPDYGEGLITSGHLLSEGEAVDQYTESDVDEIGTARDVTVKNGGEIDFAFIDMTSNEFPTDYITTQNNDDYWKKIDGVVTDQTLNNQAGNNWEVGMQGANSCRKYGDLSGTRSDIFGNTQLAVVDELMADGDSGGPMFREQNGNVYLVGEIVGSVGSNKTGGTTAETIESELGGNFQ